MNLTKIQRELLLHRLESGCIAGCLADADENPPLESDAEIAVDSVMLLVSAGVLPFHAIPAIQLDVIEDAMDGSTFFADSQDAVTLKEISRGRLLAMHKAANELETAFFKATGRRVSVPRA